MLIRTPWLILRWKHLNYSMRSPMVVEIIWEYKYREYVWWVISSATMLGFMWFIIAFKGFLYVISDRPSVVSTVARWERWYHMNHIIQYKTRICRVLYSMYSICQNLLPPSRQGTFWPIFKFWCVSYNTCTHTLIARFMGPTWGPSGADRTQVGPMLAPWTLLSGLFPQIINTNTSFIWRLLLVGSLYTHSM